MKTFEFKLTLQGSGTTEEQAWTDAVAHFTDDPGSPASTELVAVDDGSTTYPVLTTTPDWQHVAARLHHQLALLMAGVVETPADLTEAERAQLVEDTGNMLSDLQPLFD